MKFPFPQKPLSPKSDIEKTYNLFEIQRTWNGKKTKSSYIVTCNYGHKHKVTNYHNQHPGEWVCEYCGRNDYSCKYIATGHDHTDYSFFICNCDGARKNGKPWAQLV